MPCTIQQTAERGNVMRKVAETYDVVVIGGGPAGAVTAGILASRGHRVIVLEKEKFPRYHIGESLNTGTLPALDDLGLRSEMDRMRFTKKYGGTLLWGAEQGTWDFRFADAGQYEYSYQVTRADFDAMLLTRCRDLGVDVLEDATAGEPIFEGDRMAGITYTIKGEQTGSLHARFVIDASGQAKVLGRRMTEVEWYEDLRNIAIWTYLQGGRRYEGTHAGDVITENCLNGWLWFIPLADNTISVGFVAPAEELTRSGRKLRELFEIELARSHEVCKLVDGARRVAGFRTARDWSYRCERLQGPGWALVGDAAAFVDPVMSAGVGMAMRAAKGLAETLDWVLRHPDDEGQLLRRYESDYQRFITDLLEFVQFFYDRTKKAADYHTKARSLVDAHNEPPQRSSFAVILSGLAGLHEVFTDPAAGLRATPRPRAVWSDVA